MLRHVLGVVLVTGFTARLLACSSVDSAAGGVHAPCTRDKDCKEDLVCAGGVCVQGDAGDDADDGAGGGR